MRKLNPTRWTPLRTLRAATLSLALIAVGCEGDRGPQGDPGTPGEAGPKGDPGTSATVDPSLSTVDKAFVGIGGKTAIQGLQNFELTTSGTRYAAGEGFRPEDAPLLGSTSDGTVISYDLAGDKLAIHHKRALRIFGFNVPQDYKEIINGNLGFLEGTESLFGIPGGPLLSDRTASIRRQQRLLNPHLILKELAATPSRATDGGAALLDGSLHNLLVVTDSVHPITLYVNAKTGKISKLVTLENEPLHRDVPLEIFYEGWEATPSGLLFPKHVYIGLDGHLLAAETRKTVTVNGTLAASLFQFPAGSPTPTYNAEEAARGEANHSAQQMFASFGIPMDGQDLTVTATQLAPGVHYIRGLSHNTIVVEQANGIVVLEAPLYPERGDAIITWIKAQFPGKPITHVLATHHHSDHAGGLRSFVPEGTKVVVHESSASFYQELFRAPSTVRPDSLARNPAVPSLVTVPVGGSIRLDDAAHPVVAYHLPNTHAADMLLFYLPSEKIAFASDLFNPGQGGFGNGPRELYTAITTTYSLDVTTVTGGHGNTSTLADLQQAAGL
ncbi:MBL fold metallo-hydrolase [Hyalangium sp.]|uniref:MBL fold metallo-hydrolase n=1 Tax=Hyalangium sp. TaxID=2028555 RepID=UPI002D60A5C6|nr:MBL fold metallo-hydrolase [Hyalangium sp.]HYH97577.1 MBL fold metallo-hydrolase [Hyalangium sp.]